MLYMQCKYGDDTPVPGAGMMVTLGRVLSLPLCPLHKNTLYLFCADFTSSYVVHTNELLVGRVIHRSV